MKPKLVPFCISGLAFMALFFIVLWHHEFGEKLKYKQQAQEFEVLLDNVVIQLKKSNKDANELSVIADGALNITEEWKKKAKELNMDKYVLQRDVERLERERALKNTLKRND